MKVKALKRLVNGIPYSVDDYDVFFQSTDNGCTEIKVDNENKRVDVYEC